MNCEICGRGPAQGYSVYRRNPLVEKGIWRCQDHMCAEAFDNKIETDWIEDAINAPRSRDIDEN